MILPDLLVDNPLKPGGRFRAGELLREIAESLDTGTLWPNANAYAFYRGISTPMISHLGAELVSRVRAAAAAFEDATLSVSLIDAAWYGLLLPQARELADDREVDELRAALRRAQLCAQPDRASLHDAQCAEVRQRGWIYREVPSLPDPLATPACTVTVGLSAFGTHPELLCYGPARTASDALETIAPVVSEHDEPIAVAAEVAALLDPAMRMRVRRVTGSLRLRVHCATYGPNPRREIVPVVEISPARDTASNSPPRA